MVAYELLLISSIVLMFIGSRIGISLAVLINMSFLEIFLINLFLMFVGVFSVFLLWNRYAPKFKHRFIKEKTLKTVKKYSWLGLIVLPSLPLTLSLSHIPAAVIYKTLYNGKKKFLLILIIGQVLRILLSIVIAFGFLKLLPFYLF